MSYCNYHNDHDIVTTNVDILRPSYEINSETIANFELKYNCQ